jgi:hypothetical protein
MGFQNVAQYANADDAGRTWFTQFRKTVSSTATVTSSYIDYSYSGGSPLANFYATTPLESAFLSASRGIYVPSVEKQYLKSIMVQSAASSATSTTNGLQQLMLCDYLMYYPFIDTDSIALQEMIQVVSMPRYSSARVMAISQAASSAIGEFTFTYTNQDGVPGRISPNIFCQIVAGGGQSLLSEVSGGGFNPFLPLQIGDSGVRSIEEVTFTVAGGGLMALVLVRPLQTFFLSSECRRTTAGNLESYGAASEVQSLINVPSAPEIRQGAVLGLISKGCAGSLASSTLVGFLETVWGE